jgi:membrane fusion protein (multidrug efflux system)
VNEIEALGTLKAKQNVVLTSTVTEYVTAIHFEDGQRVQSGELLVEMDAAEELALKLEEQARFTEAKRQVDRLTRLSGSGATAVSTLDEQKLEVQTSQARSKAIDSQIRQRQIVAPFDGVLGQRDISIGTLVQPGTLITTIDDDSIMKLDFAVPEVFLSAIDVGVEIEALTNVWPGRVFPGKVASISSRVDPVTRAITVRALIDNEDKQLRPGMLMRVQLQSNPRNTLVIPEESVITRGRKQFVYTIDEKEDATSVNLVPVSLGVRRKGEVEILGGLTVGDRVVTHGISRVRPGTRVVIKARDDGDTELRALLNQSSS